MANQNHITKQIGKRALALALAIATAVGSWSLDWNTLRVEAYASTFDSDGTNYTSGGTITEYYTNETTGYQKLTGVSFCVGTLKDGNAIYTVNVYDGDMKAEIGTAQGGNITAVGQVNVTGIDATIAPGDSVNVVITFTQVTASSLATKKDGTDGSEVMLTLEDTTAPATSVTISSCTSALAMGQSGQIVAVDETYGRAITYTSSDTSIVTVDSEGVITPVSSGTASITAKTSVDGDTSASATVSVVDVAFSNTNLTFTGAAQLPTVTATVGSTTLTKSSDYSVSGSGTDVGTYTATVTGSGSYAGVSASSDFTIAQADMADATVDSASCTIDTTTSSVTAVSGVKLGSYALTYGTDFTASATRTSGSLVGSNYVYTYTVTLTGTGNMTGTKTITGVTATADAGITLSDVYSIEVPEEADLYVGNTEEEIKKAVVVKDANGNKVTDPGFAYTISAIDKAGTVTVKATYANYYAGEISTTFTLYCNISNNNKVAATLSGATTSDGKWVYTGNAIEPGVTVTYDSSTTLIEGTDYTITYSNNTDAGNGSVVITGKGNYTGSITKTFTIVPNITNATIKIGGNSVVAKSANNFVSGYSTTYTGSAITPSLVVNLNGSKLTQGTNYTATWSNNTNAGDATVTITTSGDSYGVQSVSATFTITPASITGGTLSLETTSYTYSGNAYKPEDVTLTVGGTALAATDYTLEYSNNTNAGTAFVTATGTGNYTDSISTSFTIHPKTMTASNTTVTFADMSYTGSALEPMPTSVVVDSVTLEEGTDYSETLTYSNNKNIGTATGTITGTGNYTGSVSGTFQIKARAILGSQITYIVSGSEEVAYTDLTVTGSGSSALGNYISSYSAVYNGYERKPAIKVMDGDSALVRNRDYTLTYANNTDAGTATVTIAGKGNYAGTGSVVISYTVSKCDLNNSRITINSDTMTPGDNTTVEVTDSDRTSSTSRPSGLLELYDSSSNADGDYTITWNDDTTTAGADKTMTLTGQNNYTGERVVTYNQGVDISEGSMTIYDRITDGLVSGSVNGYSVSKVTYMGETSCGEIGPAIKVGAKVNATDASTSILTKGTHYTVRYDAVSGNGYDAGSIVKVTATGAGATHYGTLVGYYYIIPAPLDTTNYKLRFSGDGADASVNGSGQFTKNYAYSSSVITPNFTLTYAPLDKTNSNAVLKETVLTSGTDYTYTPPTMSGDIGDKTGTFTGGGSNFDSTTEVEVLYTIGAADVADATIADISDQDYTGSAIQPDLTVTYNGTALTVGTDYTVTYSNNTNAGEASVTITGIGNYTGTQTKTFNIVQKQLTSETVTIVLASSSKKYTGSAITLTEDDIEVYYNKKTKLNYGTDYTITYTNNVNPGKATLTLAGGTNGTYGADGTATATLDIYLDLADTDLYTVEGLDVDGDNELVYYGNDTWKYKDGSAFSTSNIKIYTTDSSSNKHYLLDASSSAYALVTSNLTQPTSTASVTINGAGANYFCTGTLKISNIKNYVDVSLLTWDGLASTYAYTGSDIKPQPTVYYGSTELTQGSDFTYQYYHEADNFSSVFSDASTNNIRYFYLQGNGMFTGTTDSASWAEYKIKYDLSKTTASGWDSSYAYGEKPSDYRQPVTLIQETSTGNVTVPSSCYTVTYTSSKGSGTSFNDAGATITVSITPNSANAYAYNTKTLSYTITGIDVSGDLVVTLESATYTYTGSAITPTVSSVTYDGTTLSSSQYTVTYKNNVNAGTATVVVTGTGNYTGSTEKTFTINKKSITAESVVAEFPTVTYTGSAITKEALADLVLRDTLTGNTLTVGTDLTLQESGGVNAGTDNGTVRVIVNSDQTNYTGNKTYTFDISPLDLREGTLVVDGNSTEYTGSVVTPAITVKIDGTVLASSKYTVTYNGGAEMKDIGTYTMLIEPASSDGNIIGSLNETYTITGRYISTSDSDTTLRSDSTHNYTLAYTKGTSSYSYGDSITLEYDANTPATFDTVTLVDKDHSNYTLVEDTDYTVTYEDNDVAGEATLVITGINNYAGTVEQTFHIGHDLSAGNMNLSSEVLNGLEYNGTAQKPEGVTVVVDGETLVATKQYTLSYTEDLTNVGTKTVTATAIPSSGYYGTKTATYDITKRTIDSNNRVKIVPNLSTNASGAYYADYTGAEIEPDVEVYVDLNENDVFTEGEKLTTDDYAVTYSNNVDASENALISVTLCGNYNTKTITKKFTIANSAFSEAATTIVVNDRSYTYTGSEITPSLTVYQDLSSGERVTLTLDEDYKIYELEDNINPGDATVTIKGLGSFEGTAEATFVIAADFESAFGITADVNGDGTNDNSISVPTQLYTGAALTPAAEVVVGGETLRKDTDYIVDNVTFTAYDTDGNPTAGTVDITGNNKYYKNTYTASFDVTTDLSQVELTYSGLDDVIYTGEAQKLTNFKVYDPSGNTVTYDEDGVTYTSSSDGEECVEVGTVTVSIPITIGTVSDTVTTTYNIVQANIAAATYTGGANSTYRGTALTPPVVLYYRGNTLVANEDYTIVYDNNTNPTSTTSTGTTPDPATITITGINNFTGSYTQEFQIYPERMREVSATPVGSDGMTVSWDKLDNVTGYRIEVMTTSSSVPVKTVTVANASTTSTTITGLSEGTTYSFRAYSYVTVEGTTYYGLLNSITTATGIYTPQITVASNTTRRATLTWSVTNSGVKYMIYRSDTANGEYAYIARTTTDANSFTDKKLTSGRTYYYKIRAYRYPGEYGEYSDAAAVTVK